ncbi:DUF262 domain-containing protein [Roseovarius atlanticus]|uniref:DUF262 domain-containing protein n=1 Tax=Roseovarius atlanticus TaxID=1641875 RepID=UPI001C93D6DE|nr:DUF262 domain-containing protein [Roseovarius atlanticus]MBY5989335.1 DUF262 domain-containing HNH endonuclease family protein [Roseovarius atlanticus]MBY6124727.1 DUF262 domain-containing HNH endonuclease family protein [Roseovarius atlanticus]MBY6149222.1 DUF262 domain-containing HNH endonuclease family protein [Roseovarius atlanticus]
MAKQTENPVSSYDPKKEPIGQLLSLTNPSLIVPDWQRNYSWKTEHVEVFWNDLIFFMDREGPKPKGEYFLGSVVIVKTQSGDYKLLDGQQRLATSAILLSVIRDQIKSYKPNAADQFQSQFLVGFDHVEEKSIHKLRLNVYDKEYFRRLILIERDGDYEEPTPQISSHYLLHNTRTFFEGAISDLISGLSEKERFEKCMLVARCLLNHMTVISVYSTDEDSAAEVFETLNDRGIGLSTPDLLRNLIIRRADEEQRDTVVELWQEVVSFETDGAIKNFLRHYWVSRYGDVKSQSLYREIKRKVEAEKIDSIALSTSLSDSAASYRMLLGANTDDAEFNKVLSEVKEFGASSSILLPVLLGLFETVSGPDLVICSSNLLNVFVRHSVIANRENSKLENVIYAAVRELRSDASAQKFNKTISEYAPTDAESVSAFKKLSITHNGSRRAILKRFELDLRQTEELDIASPSRVHVEHIYPQKPKEGERWEDHGRLVNRLGNLTLLSARLNKEIKNGNFELKKPAFSKSELLMTKALAAGAGWSAVLMNSRQEKMAKKVPVLWPLLKE